MQQDHHLLSPQYTPSHPQPLILPQSSFRLRSISPISQPRSPLSSSSGVLNRPNYDSSSISGSKATYDPISVRKRTREAPDSTLDGSQTSQWEYYPAYDVMMHLTGCDTCQAYLDHLGESERQPSFQNAVKVRDRQRDAYFFDGVSEGRRRQRDDDDHIFADRDRYRVERNKALETISQHRIESHDSREELRMVKDHLRASQAECDRLRQQIEILNRENVDLANKFQRTQVDAVEVDLAINEDYKPLTPQTEITGGSPPFPTPAPAKKELPVFPEPISPPSAPTSYAAVASIVPPASSAALTSSTNTQRVLYPPVQDWGSPPTSQPLNTNPPPASSSSIRNPKSIRQLQSLMTAAHEPGNDGALSKVKILCSEAHATPRELKTDLQRYLLSNWRNPASSPTTNPNPNPNPHPPVIHNPTRAEIYSTPKINPRTEDPVEVWYEYLSAHQTSWPRGVRRDAFNRPHLADLKASRTVARLRPEVEPPGNVTPRAEFMLCVAGLFSVPGAYQEHLEQSRFKVAPMVTFRPYRGPNPVTVRDVVRHFADCGITVTTASQELEPWAQSYKASGVTVS